MTNILLEAKHIKRDFKDKDRVFYAVKDISFDLHEGEVISFIGPNGAGKTTLLKSISNYLVPTSGNIEVMGINLLKWPRKARRKMGVVFGGDRGFYNNATARENLRFFGRLLDVKEKELNQNVEQALETVELVDVGDKKTGTFSKGMLQRLHIARGLVNNPKILMLDEPTAGLDVEAVYEIRALVKKLKQQGHGIILTSHDMADIENLADRIFLIGGGEIHFIGDISALKEFAKVDQNESLEKTYLQVADQLKRRD